MTTTTDRPTTPRPGEDPARGAAGSTTVAGEDGAGTDAGRESRLESVGTDHAPVDHDGAPTTLRPHGGAAPGAQADPEALRAIMDGRWGWVRDELRATLDPTWCHPTDHLSTDEHRAATTERLAQIVTTGGHLTSFATDVGGRADVGASTVHFETLGYADLSLTIKAGVQWGLFAGSIQALGTAEHHQRWLPGAMDFSIPGCFAMTESGHGSDVASLGTTATYDETTGEIVVNTPGPADRKDYIGNAARDARLAVVFAQLSTKGEDHGVHAVVVPLRDESGAVLEGITISDDGRKAGLNGVDNGRIVFDHVRVPRTNLLDKYGQVAPDGTYSSTLASRNARFFTTLGALVKGRVCIGGGAIAATRQALAIAVTYAESRTQFAAEGGGEVTLLDYRTHQRRLLPALARTVALGFAQDDLTAELHAVQQTVLEGGTADPEASRVLESHAAGMKALATWNATATIQTAREACGGNGYLSENRLAQLKADTDVFTTFEGDNTVLLQLVAKGLLTGYRDSFKGLDRLGQAKHVTSAVLSTVAVRTEARAVLGRLAQVNPWGDDDGAAVLDRTWQLRALAWREARMLDSLVARMRSLSKTMTGAQVANEVQDHMVSAARAHVERVVAESFASAVDAQEAGPERDLLSSLVDLHVLSEVERDRGWFLEHGWITPARSKALTAAVNDLCAAVRPQAATVVAGFGIPRSWWGAAITA